MESDAFEVVRKGLKGILEESGQFFRDARRDAQHFIPQPFSSLLYRSLSSDLEVLRGQGISLLSIISFLHNSQHSMTLCAL